MADKGDEETHFKGKSALEHITSVQVDGIEASLEIHGAEAPGSVFAFLDSAREIFLLFSFMALFLYFSEYDLRYKATLLVASALSFSFWKGSRATWLSWLRLERLHRISGEEKHEIETNREQEKLELLALYKAKGLSGDLLHRVVDVFMADEERALKVMLEEELGLRLYQNTHPLLIGLSASIGSLLMLPFGFCMVLYCSPFQTIFCSAVFSFILGYLYASYEKNSAIRAGCWSASISVTSSLIFITILQ